MARKNLIAALLILLLIVTACGDDDDNKTAPTPTPEAEPTEEATATPEAEPTGEPTPEPTSAPIPAATSKIVIGEISDDPDRSITRMQPLADYLAANLSKAGVEAVEIDIPPDLDTMVEKLQNGEIDLTFDSLYPAMIMRNEGGAQPILRRWRDGVGEYHTVFFALAASGIESPDDLKGKMVAFDAPDSTSGYLVPVAFLIEAGLNPVEKSSETAAVAEDEVGYVFSGGDDNTLLWITSGVVAAGVVDNVAFSELPQETLDQVVILAETSPVPRQVVLAGGDLDPDLLAAIIAVLVGMDETEAGRAALEEYRTGQFDEFPEGLDTALADMEQMYGLVQNR